MLRFRLGARCPRPSPSVPSSLSSPRVVCPLGSVASTAALSALGAGPAWLGVGGGMWILRRPFVVTKFSSLFRLCAMCDLACSPRRCCRASCNPQHPTTLAAAGMSSSWLVVSCWLLHPWCGCTIRLTRVNCLHDSRRYWGRNQEAENRYIVRVLVWRAACRVATRSASARKLLCGSVPHASSPGPPCSSRCHGAPCWLTSFTIRPLH